MTAHWIKVEKDTAAKPEVMRLAAILDIDEFTVVGHLIAFWSWVDSNLSPECPQTQGTKRGLDRIAGRTGFCDALISVGWLTFDGDLFGIPNMGRHMGQSAKLRAMDKEKKAKKRVKPDSVPELSPKCPPESGTNQGQKQDKSGTREEQKREEEVNTQTQAPAKPGRVVFVKPEVHEVIQYTREIGSMIDGQEFCDFYESKGWRVGNSPMKDWKAALRQWESRRKHEREAARDDKAQRAGFHAQARQDAQWDVFREFTEAAARDQQRERQRGLASGDDNGSQYRIGNHASVFSEEPGADDTF